MTAHDSMKPARSCPTCGRPMVQDYRPFCSKRCADIDLARWLKGVYVVPGDEAAGEDGGPDADGAGSAQPPKRPEDP